MACLRGGAVVVAGAVIALAATACGAESVMRHVEPSEAEAVSETPVAPEQGIDERPVRQIVDADGVPVEFVDISIPSEDEIEELPYEIIRQHEHLYGVESLVWVFDVADDGGAFVSISDQTDFDTEKMELTRAARLAIWDDGGFHARQDGADTLEEVPIRNAGDGVFVGDQIVWSESSSMDLYEDSWRIFRQQREGGEVHLIAQSEQVFPEGPHPVVAGWKDLVASEDEVAWHASFRRDDGTIRTAVVSVPADGGELTIEQELATLPASSGAGWVTLRMVDASVENVDPEWRIQDPTRVGGIDLVSPEGTIRTLLDFSGSEAEPWIVGRRLAADEGIFAWSQESDIYVASTDGSSAFRINGPSDGELEPESLAVCNGRVHWAILHGEWNDPVTMYAFDPDSEEVRVVENEGISYYGLIECGGQFASWRERLTDERGEVQRVVVARWRE